MTDHELYDHFRFEGARILLRPLAHREMPEDVAERDALLQPMIRAAVAARARGGRTLYEIAAELFAAAELTETRPDVTLTGISGPPAALREIAEHLIGWNAKFSGEVVASVRTSDELALRFPSLTGMLVVYYGQDGIAAEAYPDDPRLSLRAVIDDWHPACQLHMPPLAAECQEALTLFQTEEALEQFFAFDHGGGSHDLPWLEWLPLIIDVMGEHMRAQHPLRWEPRRPR